MMDSSTVWNSQDPTLSISSQDDFQQFLDMNLDEPLQFSFQDFNSQHSQTAQLGQREDGETMDPVMDNGRALAGQDTTMQEHMPAMTTAASHPAIHAVALAHSHSSNESVDYDAQIQHWQNQKYQHQQRQMQEQQQQRNFYVQSRMIPPTPNSIEMHGNHGQFYQPSDPQQQAMYERYQMQVKEQEIAFTPLGTPAVTPLESRFPEFTVPGAYLSPLSSPALHAQNEHAAVYDQRHSGATNSPIDMNLDSHSAPANSSILPRKASKKSLQKPRNARGIRQSPIVKPKKGKKGSSTSISEQALGEIIEPAQTKGVTSKATSSSHSTASTEDSENGSISPEHLSDMAPPPVPPPGSAGRSPYIQSQKSGTRAQQLQALGSPATPASLMRLAGSPQVNQQANNNNQYMDIDDPEVDGFSLPEAANSRPQLSRIETQSDGQVTPTLSSTGPKTPGFQPLPSPAFNRPRSTISASQSPQIDAMNGSAGVNGTSRKPSIAARSSKKRSSSSVLASPALLPRISPSIKPLLPGGKVAEDTASLLLASKSNYQNILEGTHLPGVSYPTELSTNLTSKRTSHKIAEQGRRNRINSALQEIATLLPRGQTKDSGGEKSGSGDACDNNDAPNGKGGSQSANSKASTVEQAIEYIKQLKKDLADANKRAEEAEKLLKEKA